MIDIAHHEQIAVLTLNQPQRGNALSEPLVEALIAAVNQCIGDASIHTLVISASGRHFCTGFDLGDRKPAIDADTGHAAADGPLLWRFARIEHLLALLWHAPLRTVAVAQGRAWGAGADLFATCDLRYAAADAEWRFPGAGFGLVLGTRRLASLVGQPQALDWVTHGRRIDAAGALEFGLASALLGHADDWRSTLPSLAVDRSTQAQLKAATRPDHRDADLAALVRSAARPGLAERLENYKNKSATRR